MGRSAGTYTRCENMFREKRIQSYPFASLNTESSIIFDKNLSYMYL